MYILLFSDCTRRVYSSRSFKTGQGTCKYFSICLYKLHVYNVHVCTYIVCLSIYIHVHVQTCFLKVVNCGKYSHIIIYMYACNITIMHCVHICTCIVVYIILVHVYMYRHASSK